MSAAATRYFMCARKKPLTRKQAIATRDSWVAEGGAKGDIYQCQYGRHWHVTKTKMSSYLYLRRASDRAAAGLRTPGWSR